MVDTQDVNFVLDIGGANGEVVRAMMRANPVLCAGVFDLPHVVPDAAEAAARTLCMNASPRWAATSSSRSRPPICTCSSHPARLGRRDCVRILKNCRASLQEGGRLVAIDYLVDELGTPGLPALMDMNMLVMAGGKERNIDEFDELFEAAGLRRTSVGQAVQFAVIETVAA